MVVEDLLNKIAVCCAYIYFFILGAYHQLSDFGHGQLISEPARPLLQVERNIEAVLLLLPSDYVSLLNILGCF